MHVTNWVRISQTHKKIVWEKKVIKTLKTDALRVSEIRDQDEN